MYALLQRAKWQEDGVRGRGLIWRPRARIKLGGVGYYYIYIYIYICAPVSAALSISFPNICLAWHLILSCKIHTGTLAAAFTSHKFIQVQVYPQQRRLQLLWMAWSADRLDVGRTGCPSTSCPLASMICRDQVIQAWCIWRGTFMNEWNATPNCSKNKD